MCTPVSARTWRRCHRIVINETRSTDPGIDHNIVFLNYLCARGEISPCRRIFVRAALVLTIAAFAYFSRVLCWHDAIFEFRNMLV